MSIENALVMDRVFKTTTREGAGVRADGLLLGERGMDKRERGTLREDVITGKERCIAR